MNPTHSPVCQAVIHRDLLNMIGLPCSGIRRWYLGGAGYSGVSKRLLQDGGRGDPGCHCNLTSTVYICHRYIHHRQYIESNSLHVQECMGEGNYLPQLASPVLHCFEAIFSQPDKVQGNKAEWHSLPLSFPLSGKEHTVTPCFTWEWERHMGKLLGHTSLGRRQKLWFFMPYSDILHNSPGKRWHCWSGALKIWGSMGRITPNVGTFEVSGLIPHIWVYSKHHCCR